MVIAYIFVDGIQFKQYENKKRSTLYGIAMREFRKLSRQGKNVFVLYDYK